MTVLDSPHSGQPVEIGIDGEVLVLDPRIEFRTLPGALLGPHPARRPRLLPVAAAPTKGWATITALLRTAVGGPVTLAP